MKVLLGQLLGQLLGHLGQLLGQRVRSGGTLGALLRPLESRFAQRFVLPRLSRKPHIVPGLPSGLPPGLPSGSPLPSPRVARERVQHTFETARSGVSVVVSPRGSGKSTTLAAEFNNYVRTRGHGVFVSPDAFRSCRSGPDACRAFFALCGGEQRCHDLCDVLPPRSTIVFDVFDDVAQAYTEPLVSVLKSLMTESVRSGNVSVVVASSCVDMARLLLNLNGGGKTQILCPPSAFRWSADQVADQLDRLLATRDFAPCAPCKRDLLTLAVASGSAGFLPEFKKRLGRLSTNGGGNAAMMPAMQWAFMRSQEDAAQWHAFAEFERV